MYFSVVILAVISAIMTAISRIEKSPIDPHQIHEEVACMLVHLTCSDV